MKLRVHRTNGRGQPARGGLAAWELGEELTTFHRKKTACYEMLHGASVLATSF